jgi:heat shock protein HslJ
VKHTRPMLAMALAGALLGLTACQARSGETPQAAATAADTPVAPGIKTLYVGPELVNCTGVASQKCMQTREKLSQPWSIFYNQIEGFTFEPGYYYELLVAVTQVPNAPADASNVKYTLVKQISKTDTPPLSNSVVGDATAGATAGATAAAASTTTTSLEGPTWVLESFGDPSAPTKVANGTRVTANFASNKLTGKGGCNSYFGSYTATAGTLTVSGLGATQMACPEPAMSQETAYLKALGQAESYAIKDGTLAIVYGGGKALSYMAEAPASLDGSAWNVLGYNNGKQAVVSTLQGTELTMGFLEGRVSGNAGCNTYNAPYTVDGDKITIGPLATTRKMCADPAGVMDQEAQFLSALQTAATWKIDGDQLGMRTAADAMAVNGKAAIVTK